MADNSTQKVISKITTILDRMDAETRANTLEQIATHIKELNNDMKIEETSNKNHLLKIKMNHNGFKRALPDTVKETLVANLWKNKCEISAMSYPGGCEIRPTHQKSQKQFTSQTKAYKRFKIN
ncbi:hypothetical protein TYRP_010854 [Tyrophagus putrescentiae]|nr:hypothetical protein TYRP_010854 [Tyrophagus putrescentiae]